MTLQPGMKLGLWTLVEQITDVKPTRWKCVCDCGTKRTVLQSSMVTGRSRQCGCKTPKVSLRGSKW